ncbi:hypothetical protein Lal_00012932 [Lupinus albus]|nr:hypothetical protein Lal_00012932 [Lupinus albus]
MNNSRWLIGDGHNTNFWKDNWFDEPLMSLVNLLDEDTPLLASLADFINGNLWKIPALLADKFPQVAAQIYQTTCSPNQNQLIWEDSSDGFLSFKCAFQCINHVNSQPNWCKILWSATIPPSNKECLQCEIAEENSEHLFLQCAFASEIWQWINNTFETNLEKSSILTLLQYCQRKLRAQAKDLLLAAIIHVVSTIWFCRNYARFQDKKFSLPQALVRIQLDISLTGNQSKTNASSSMHDFNIIRVLNVNVNYKKAPKIGVFFFWFLLGRIKINSDGAAHGCLGHSRGGAVFRNHKGEFLTCFAYYYGIHNALFA